MNGDLNGTKSPKPAQRSSLKGRMQVALLDDTVVAFDVEVSPNSNYIVEFSCLNIYIKMCLFDGVSSLIQKMQTRLFFYFTGYITLFLSQCLFLLSYKR